jgi:spore coat protein CotF
MVFSILKRNPQYKQQLVDTQEAFNLWDILKSNYLIVEKLNSWEIFAHDLDLKIVLRNILAEKERNIQILEKQLQKYSIKGSNQKNRVAINTPVNPEVLQDELIANEAFLYIQEHVENLLRAVRTSFTNDGVRHVFLKMTIATIELADKMVQYLKLKGWIETPPLYLDIPATLTEKLTTVEAYHLWDQLTYRYDNLRQTSIYLSFAFDGDFKVVLNMGIAQLKKHSHLLEKQLQYFGIPLPKQPSSIVVPPANTEIFDDEHMYRVVLIGIEGTTTLHAQALKQCTFNDRVRNIFKNLLLEEIGFLDRFIKFGKTKGWLNPVPAYRAQ